MILAERFARYALSLKYEDLPSKVIHETKRRFIDSFGCAIAALSDEPGKVARHYALQYPGPPRLAATVLGTQHKTTPDLAAFANGTLVRYFDYNDTYLSKEPAHPSDNLAAVLAAGEASGSSGKDLITALVLAYEIQCRLCDAASLRKYGYDHVTYGVFSTTLAAGKLFGLTQEQLIHAQGIAGVCNIALRQTRTGTLSHWKACAFANVAKNGIFSALLAKKGMTGPAPIFEGEKGFCRLISGSIRISKLGGEEGAPFKILETYIKRHPAEYHAQAGIDAALKLRERLGGNSFYRRLKKVSVISYEAAISIIGKDKEKWDPKSRETADHSYPYLVGAALVDGKVSLDQFDKCRYRDRDILNLMKKIEMKEDGKMTQAYPKSLPAALDIVAGSQRYSCRVDYPKGHYKNPLSDGEVETKFKNLAESVLGPRKTSSLLDLLWNLEKLSKPSPLFSLCIASV